MKKLLFAIALVLGISSAASAQSRAIGGRFTYGGELSYQHAIGKQFIQGDMGWSGNYFSLHGTYNFMIAAPDWTDGTWGVYIGPGAGIVGSKDYAAIAACGLLGLEYVFPNVPLQLSVDVRPDILRISNDGITILGGLYPAMGIRYVF